MKPTRIAVTLPDGKTIVARAGERVTRNKRPALDIMERTMAANALRRFAYLLDRSAR